MASTDTTFDTDCKLMLHMDGADQSTTFTDSSDSGHTMGTTGTVQLDTAYKVFGTASGMFDGTDDYLDANDSADWLLGSGDFTIDARVRFGDVGDVVATIIAQYDSAAPANKRSFSFDWVGYGVDSLRFVYSENGDDIVATAAVDWTPVVDTWYHVTVVRNGANLYFFINGTQQGSTQNLTGVTLADVPISLSVGSLISADNEFTGHIDELRFVKGTAVWTSNFTSPSAAYTPAGAPGGPTRRVFVIS